MEPESDNLKSLKAISKSRPLCLNGRWYTGANINYGLFTPSEEIFYMKIH
jgi:hypothetical protein